MSSINANAASSSSGTAAMRAASPTIKAVLASSGRLDVQAKLAQRHMLIIGCASVAEVIALIPHWLRSPMSGVFDAIANAATKSAAASATVLKWTGLKDKGIIPSNLKVAAPTVQLHKEFMADPKYSTWRKALDTAVASHQTAMVDKAIEGLKDEVNYWEAQLTMDAIQALATPIVMAHVTAFRQRSIYIEDVIQEATAATATTAATPRSVSQKQTVSPAVDLLLAEVQHDMMMWCSQVLTIVRTKIAAADSKLRAKKTVKAHVEQEMDVNMEDVSSGKIDINKLVQQAVQRQVKSTSKGKVRSLSFLFDDVPANCFCLRSILTEEIGWQEENDQQKTKYAGRIHTKSAHDTLPSSSSRQEARQASSKGSKKAGQDVRQTGRKGKGKEKVASRIAIGDYVVDSRGTSAVLQWDEPSSYPDWLVSLPLPLAVSYVKSCIPIDILLAAQYKNLVHLSPGVTLPIKFHYNLSVGMKFMFHSKRNAELIKTAYEDFVRRASWRIYFAFQDLDEQNSYDPEYEYPRPIKGKVPILPDYIRYGFDRGGKYVQRTVNQMPDEEPRQFRSLNPGVKEISEYLSSHNYIVTATDKNLGIAVSEIGWVREKSIELLSDQQNYRKITKAQVNFTCAQVIQRIHRVADYIHEKLLGVETQPWAQIEGFLRHQCTPWDVERNKFTRPHKLPVFYGIPKIHKEPVKFRPIVPCHSAIQNPAAKFVDKQLRPIVLKASTVIHGTKDLAIKLSKIQNYRKRPIWLVTGDVVAFYPNINITTAIDIAADLYAEEYYGGDENKATETQLMEARVFIDCLRIGNQNLLLQFEDSYYEQVRGLAMGVSDSPSLANLYGWFYERNSGILNDPTVLLYGRYIDDCLAIIYAETAEEAIRTVSDRIKFKDCTIEWEASSYATPFLDMYLYIDSNGHVQHIPYQKAQNHLERIPYISNHSSATKRAAIIGEISRMAVLCSTFTAYKHALNGLKTIYVKRGYPSRFIESIIKENIAERWNRRLVETSVQTTPEDVLVLKSHYNTAWNYFSAQKLHDIVSDQWNRWLKAAEQGKKIHDAPPGLFGVGEINATPEHLTVLVSDGVDRYELPDIRKIDIMSRRWLVSQKRNKNLFDLATTWKQSVIRKREVDNLTLNIQDVAIDEQPFEDQLQAITNSRQMPFHEPPLLEVDDESPYRRPRWNEKTDLEMRYYNI
jgi:hypothetical protein